MRKSIFTLAGIFFSVWLHAQTEKPELVTDRPDQTEAPVLVPKGGLQIETGFVLEEDRDNDVQVSNFAYNTTLIKYGVNDNIELRFITEYLGQKVKISESQVSSIQGFSPIALGVKMKIADEKGFWPQTAMIGHISLKSGSAEFMPSYTAGDFRFTFAHTLSDKLALSYNLGAEWNGETPDATFLYTLSLGYLITDRLGVFVEAYSFFPEEAKADHRVDGGLTYKFSQMFQWDVSAGLGISENAPDSFISTGFSLRLFK